MRLDKHVSVPALKPWAFILCNLCMMMIKRRNCAIRGEILHNHGVEFK